MNEKRVENLAKEADIIFLSNAFYSDGRNLSKLKKKSFKKLLVLVYPVIWKNKLSNFQKLLF